MHKVRRFLWTWLFSDFAKQCDDRLNKFFKSKAEDFTQEHQAFIREFREQMRNDSGQAERRHQELVSAIASLKR